jgi:transcriptional regulator with XRE-family HTH domain
MASNFQVSQSGYGNWEKTAEPSLDVLLELAEFFKVPFGDFITKKLEHKDIPPRWGGREYPVQPEPSSDVAEEVSHEEVAAVMAVLSKLQKTLEEVVKKTNDLPAIREEVERLKKEVASLKHK